MIQKLLGLIFIAGAGFLAWHLNNDNSLVPTSTKKEVPKAISFSDFVSEDLSSLRQQGHLPKEWDEIQHVAYQMHSAFQRELIGKNKIAAIPENPSGRFKLEIEFIDVPDDENPGLILQMSMMDVQTNNKVWELGRTYPLKAFLKKPDKKSADTSAKKDVTAEETKTEEPNPSAPSATPTPESPKEPSKK